MQRYAHIILSLAFAVCTSAASSQTSENDLRAQAQTALVAGNFQAAQTLAETALAQTPTDFDALLILALSQVELGDNSAAVSTAAKAYSVAPSDATRVQAARLVANAHVRARHFTRAEFWLRRAANNAKTDAEAEAVVREYFAVVQANPLSAQFNAAIFPTDNLNGGSEDGILRLESIGLTLFLPETRSSLSGVGYSGSAALTYRLFESPDQAVSISGSLSGRTYSLSSEAKSLLASSIDPDVQNVTGSDFSTASASVGLEFRDNRLSPLGPVTATLDTGSNWEGGTRIISFNALGLQQAIPLNDRSLLNFSALWRDQKSLTPFLVDAKVQDVSASYSRLLASGNQVQFNLAYRYIDAGFENIFDEYRLGVGFGLGEPVLGTKLSASLEIGTREYDEFTTTLDGRRDRFASAQINATFTQISYFGFSPGIALSGTRTESSAEENTSSAVQLLFGIESSF